MDLYYIRRVIGILLAFSKVLVTIIILQRGYSYVTKFGMALGYGQSAMAQNTHRIDFKNSCMSV